MDGNAVVFIKEKQDVNSENMLTLSWSQKRKINNFGWLFFAACFRAASETQASFSPSGAVISGLIEFTFGPKHHPATSVPSQPNSSTCTYK